MEVKKKKLCRVCQQRFGGEMLARARAALFSRALCFCAYQKVENVIFGLAMFAEGQSGLVPKTSQWSQPNLGKHAICACACLHDTHKAHMMQTNKQTNGDPGFLCLSLFVAKNTHGDTRHFLTEHHRLSGVKIQVAYSSFSSFQRAGMAPCMKES